ncbi:hypothetical protein [Streptomyces sp. 8L]|uniref:hypothetical protein n=1 Tax=Streptomyces sp. 8L TaxID=2877242 RepID=UPI001CD3EB7C|nr:hypothetical protein [Streptomyces sp. 8L]MCA1222721.1 hypothetical protein [Streptomyces sp. 8L]
MALAHKAFGRLGSAETSDTAYGYTERQLAWHDGSMWTTLGDTRRAQSSLAKAHDLYAPTEHLDQALIAMDEASCLMQVGETSVACRETEILLLGLPEEHRTGIVISRARELLASVPVRSRTHPAVRDLHEVLETTAACPALPPAGQR